MGPWGNIVEDELLLGNNNSNNGGIVSDMFQMEADVDLMQGNVGGFVEEKLLADIF